MQLQQYKIVREINRGGSSVLYRGKEYGSGRTVAIKILREDLKNDKQRVKEFQAETKLLKQLDEKEILDLHDSGTYEDRPYMVLEYVDGESLRTYLVNKPEFVRNYWLTIGLRTANGLAALHMNNIIHKDVKPENILVTEDLQVRLIDLSIARQKSFFSFSFGSENVQGTPKYMSPEQINGETVDFPSDIYSLGVCMYEMATGDPPFRAHSEQELLNQHRNAIPRPIQEKREDLDLQLARVIMKMLKKNPEDRFSDMNMVIYNLKKYWSPPKPREPETTQQAGDTTLVQSRALDSSTQLLPKSSYVYAEKRTSDDSYRKPEGTRHRVLNLSRGGLGLLSKKKYRKKTLLDLLLVVPSLEEKIRLRGKVQWCKKGEEVEKDKYSVGVKLILQDPDYMEKFDELKQARDVELDL